MTAHHSRKHSCVASVLLIVGLSTAVVFVVVANNSKNRNSEVELAAPERSLSPSSEREVLRFSPSLESSGEPYHPVRIMHITDNHISIKDDDPPRTTRMFQAFAHTVDHVQHMPTTPQDEFVGLLQKAKEEQVDLIALGGDLINYPSPSTVVWALREIKKTGIPYVYTAGNHDWHEEGVETDTSYDSSRMPQLQTTLAPLYENSAIPVGSQDRPGLGRLYGHTNVRGVDIILVDNSNYQVTEEQLAFTRNILAASKDAPAVLVMHIPLKLPGTPSLEPKYVCGHPQWGWYSDDVWQIEQRPRWPRRGNLPSTIAFVELVRANSAPNGRIVTLLTGHVHREFSAWANFTSPPCGGQQGCRLRRSAAGSLLQRGHGVSVDRLEGALQYTTLDAAEGGYRILTVHPRP